MKAIDSVTKRFDDWVKRSRMLRRWRSRAVHGWLRWLIVCGLIAALVPMFPWGRSLQFADLKEGSISPRRIVAPFSFEILKTTEEIQQDREFAVQKVYPVFVRDEGQTSLSLQDVDEFFQEVEGIRRLIRKEPELRNVLQDSLFTQYPISVVDTLYRDQLIDPKGIVKDHDLQNFHRVIGKVIRDLLAVGVMDVDKGRTMNPDRRLIITDEEEEVIHSFDNFFDLAEGRKKASEMLNNDYPENVYLKQMGYVIINYFLRPNLIYDEETHKQRVDEAKARVPLSSGFVYKENELIVDKNERITPEIRKKLVSLATKMAEKGVQEGGIQRIFPVVGKTAFVVLVLFLLGAFIGMDKPRVLRETKSILLIALIILLVCLIAFFIHRFGASEYLVPSALGAMLLASLFDSRIGFAGTAVMSSLLGGLWGNEFNLMIVSFVVGIVGVISIKRVRSRSQLIQVIFYLIGAYIVAITTMGFLRLLPLKDIVRQWQWGALNGLLTPIVAYGLLALIESVFDLTTDFSLLELSNLNHPLLKRLSVQASGTYHHSIIVGNLAEAAAQAVRANSLLARVGSYYHDVGKIEKAEYFVENQLSGENPHEKLTPRMSALILMNHVKKGLELADKYKLPSSIKNIIAQHQGTTVMSFFYRKALNKNGAEEANEEDYRYPGPRPQSKEAAIVMLADAVEAATRSLKEPTHSRISGLVEDLVDARFKEGQLDESPLTLRDLERIKESFLMILAGTFHARVEYPDREKQKTTTKPKDTKTSVVQN